MMTGKLTDLGTSLDVRLTLTDIATGDIIGSATQSMRRTRFAMEMYRHIPEEAPPANGFDRKG